MASFRDILQNKSDNSPVIRQTDMSLIKKIDFAKIWHKVVKKYSTFDGNKTWALYL